MFGLLGLMTDMLGEGNSLNQSNFAGGVRTVALCFSQVFPGRWESTPEITHMLDEPVYTKRVRINPLTWWSAIELKFDVIGCPLLAGKIF